MKAIAKITEIIGIVCVFLGLGCMDSDLIVIPIAMLITGGAIAFAGLSIEGSNYARSDR